MGCSRGSNKVVAVDSFGTPHISAAVGHAPDALAFDGVNIWVANFSDGTVTKLRECDAANIWVTNNTANTVTVLRASDGSGVAGYNTAVSPLGIVFDGSHMWVGTLAGIVSRF
jgi:DNA-binding beta-propeller fold protein YncE